jgi:lysyl-tRNA synthetase class 2
MSRADAPAADAHPRTPAAPDPAARRHRIAGTAAVRTVVWSTRLVALLTIVSTVLPGPRRMLSPVLRSSLGLPPTIGLAGLVIALVAGVGLLLVATGLRRRKRRAWQLGVAVTAVLTVVDATRGIASRHGYGAAVAAAVLCGALLYTRRWFVARPDPRGLVRAATLFVQFALAGFGLVWLLLALNGRRIEGHPRALDEAAHAALSLIGVSGPLQFRVDWLDDLTATAGLTFGIVAVVVAGYHLLRSAEPRPGQSAEDAERLRALLAKDRDPESLGYFALRPDKAVVLAPGGHAAVAHRVLAGVALASGDPLGDTGAWPAAIEAFLAECVEHGWTPAVLACSERGATAYAKAGLDALELGDEAVLRTETFTLAGRPMKGVRQAHARIVRAGYTVRVRRCGELDDHERAAVSELAASWRGDATERGFSMALSRVAELQDPDAVLVTAHSADQHGEDRVRGLLQLVPWGADGLSLDLMRRAPDTENGVTEAMIVELMRAAEGLGVTRVSLNFALFRAALERGERIGAGPATRLWAKLLHLGSRWWQIDSLYRFNAKFCPSWTPRYLVFPLVRDVPRILLAALEAEGFGGRPPALLRVLGR